MTNYRPNVVLLTIKPIYSLTIVGGQLQKPVQPGVNLGTDNGKGLQTKQSSLDEERCPDPATLSRCGQVDATLALDV